MDPAMPDSAPTIPPQAPPAEEDAALTCPGRPPAPPVTAADLHGWWRWEHAFLIEADGKEYTTGLAGGLLLEPDGSWTGYRETDTGTLTNTASGPGTWRFDGKAFHLAYDDGSDTETYGAVRIGTHVAERDGKTYRDMSLEIGYSNGDCAAYLLEGVEVPQ